MKFEIGQIIKHPKLGTLYVKSLCNDGDKDRTDETYFCTRREDEELTFENMVILTSEEVQEYN